MFVYLYVCITIFKYIIGADVSILPSSNGGGQGGGGSSSSTSPVPSPVPPPTPTPSPPEQTTDTESSGTTFTTQATHYWDCNGAGCDSRTLQPWNMNKYMYAPNYAPVDPATIGSQPLYGEKMWMTAAASDTLAAMLGDADGCCGDDPEGGCGKCVLVTNPSAVNSDWKAVVMKKNRCPPSSNHCEEGKMNLDIAAPGFDNLDFSTANVCGESDRRDFGVLGANFLTKEQSSACGKETKYILLFKLKLTSTIYDYKMHFGIVFNRLVICSMKKNYG